MARRSVVIDLEVRNKQARKALQGVEGGFTRLSQKTEQSTAVMSQGFSRASNQVQGSTTAVSNLSRIIEDAPYGPRGVANNINPFINSFQRLQSQTGSTTTAMKTLLTSAFTGPGALLTISALVTSAITAIQMGLFDWGEEAESTEDQMETLMETMDEFIDEQREMAGENIFDPLGQASTEQRLDQVQALKNELQSLFDLRQQGEELRQTISTLRQAGAASDVQGAQDLLAQQSQQLDQVNEQIAEQERLFGELSEAEEQALQSKIDDIEATARLNDAFLKLNPAMQQRLNINQALRPVLRDVELGLSGSQEELEKLITSYEQQIEMLRGNIESEQLHGEELKINKQLLAAYTEALEQAEKAQEGLTDQEKSAAEAAKQLRRARRELAQEMGVEDQIIEPDGIDVGLEEEIARDTRIGSIGDLRADLKDLNEELDKVQIGSDQFFELHQEIAVVEKRLQAATGSAKEVGRSGRQALISASTGANMLGNALMQAVMRGEELEGVLKSLAGQLASKAFIKILTMILSGGGIGSGLASFGAGIFDTSTEGTLQFGEDLLGFAHGSDMGFPGIGRVGEHGEELLVAPPMSSVITNENVEKMHQMRQEAKNGATRSTSNIDTGAIAEAVREGIEVADIIAPVEISRMKRELSVFEELQNRIGN